MVDRLNSPDKFNPKCTDSDLWLNTNKILREMKSKIIFKHVKAHQDEVVGPLSWEEFNNVKVDLLAKRGSEMINHEDESHRIKEPMSITLNRRRITAKHDREIYHHIAGKELMKYQMCKFGWNQRVYECVDWKNFSTYMCAVGPTKIANII